MKKEFSISKRKFLLGSFALAGAAIGLGSWKIWNDFGALPRGGFDSPNWHGGEFHNLMDEPVLAEKPNMEGGWLKFMFGRGDRYPDRPVKSVKSDLKSLADNEFVWLGHSSFLLRMNGKIICVDPVLAGRASPVPFTITAWPGSMPFRASDFPHIDLLCISHDHWDHLDRLAVSALDWDRAICGLGVGSHFASWGLKKPLELDWNDKLQLDGLEIVFTPSQHFSGRGLTRNKASGAVLFSMSGAAALFISPAMAATEAILEKLARHMGLLIWFFQILANIIRVGLRFTCFRNRRRKLCSMPAANPPYPFILANSHWHGIRGMSHKKDSRARRIRWD